MYKYAVVLTTHGKAKKELSRWREKYAGYMKYTIAPHVTVKFPFTLKADISIIQARLNKIAERTKSFTLILDGVRYWEGQNNVAYVAVKNPRPVYDIHTAIIHDLEGLTAGNNTYDRENFVPHVTLGEYIPADSLPMIKEELSGFHFSYRIKVTSFTMFGSEPNNDWDIWRPVNVFKFINSD